MFVLGVVQWGLRHFVGGQWMPRGLSQVLGSAFAVVAVICQVKFYFQYFN